MTINHTDQELLELILELENTLLAKDQGPSARSDSIPLEVRKNLVVIL